MTHVVVMGVSGCGKSTVGALLADRLGVPFVDADDLHPPANLARMAAGVPLTDADRWPWLRLVGAALAAPPAGAVVACSALRRPYRDLLREQVPDLHLVHLVGTRDQLADRMRSRARHFMPVSLLDTQLATLEPLGADERGTVLDCTLDPAELAARAAAVSSSRIRRARSTTGESSAATRAGQEPVRPAAPGRGPRP